MGEPFDSDMSFTTETRRDRVEHVGMIGIGRGSPFALANPLFSIAPKPDHFALSIETFPCEAEYVYIPMTWNTDGEYFHRDRIAFDNSEAYDMDIGFHNRNLELENQYYNVFWNQIYARFPETSWFKRPQSSYTDSDCPPVEDFPSIHVSLGEYNHTIEPRDYIMMGNEFDSTRGCTVLVADGFRTNSLGTSFFARNIVQFDNDNERIGFCKVI